MKADALNPRELFGTTVHYEIPSFQRPYVWTEEDQWAPLWDDVRRLAERVIHAAGDKDALALVGGHFLGAVVFKAKSAVAGDVTRHSVIDGQQRTTTLQVLLDAVHEAVQGLDYEDEAEALAELILNQAKRFAGKPERFKLWPSRSDRAAFEYAMDSVGHASTDDLIVAAHTFFCTEVYRWLTGEVEDDQTPPGDQSTRVAALADVMQTRLLVVAVNLAAEDDDQVIFETLNDRGTPLLKADLIKNWVFQVGENVGADVDSWPETVWLDFDDTWWREEVAQGRQLRSRIDIFLQYWLTMRTREEVLTNDVFRDFVSYSRPRMATVQQAEKLLGELRKDADTFRNLAQLSRSTVEGRFYSRVVESLELASTTPLLLWLLSENHSVPQDQITSALGSMESWVIRRTFLRNTMKDVNRMIVAILASLEDVGSSKVGNAVQNFLAKQTSDARMWPDDHAVLASLPGMRLYGTVRQGRIRVVLEAIEEYLRTQRHEKVTVPSNLQLEHVMPKAWRTYWDPQPRLSVDQAAARDHKINTLGNLTLVTQDLNATLSNRPWTDAETATISTAEDHKGLGKRALINNYSLLALSRTIVDEHHAAWTDSDIDERSRRLSEIVCAIWPRPLNSEE